MLSREEARAILDQGEELAGELLVLLRSGDYWQSWAAAVLLGALQDARAVEGLVELMLCSDQGRDEVAVESLARIGEPALEAVLPLENWMAVMCLGQIGQYHPELRPRVAARLVEHLAGKQCITAAYGLADIDWQDAIPVIEANMGEPHWDRDSFYEQDVADWRAGIYKTQAIHDDPLHHLTAAHRVELDRYLADLQKAIEAQFSTPEFRARFASELASLRPHRTAVRQVQAGHNDPCPCGSGKKYKKCCLEADQSLGKPGPLEARLQTANWLHAGFRLTPCEQLAQLPQEEVFAHLDILRMPLPDLRQRMAGETNDYLLWAAANRYHDLGRPDERREAALAVALSDARHPALNYEEIASLALIDLREVRRQRLPELRLALQRGLLVEAIFYAQEELERNAEAGFRAFEEILRQHPQPLWTAAAMVDELPYGSAGRALPALEKAVEQARRGRSLPHPLLPERPCPLWVLEGYLEEVRDRACTEVQLGLIREESNTNPIGDEARGIFFVVRDREWELSRVRPPDHREQLAALHAEAARGLGLILDGAPGRRRGVLVGQSAEGLLWVVPHKCDQRPIWLSRGVLETAGDLGLQALLRAAGEAGLADLRLREGSWGGWKAYLLRGLPEDFAELAAVALSELCAELPLTEQWQTVPADWPHLLALGGEEMLAASSESPAVVVGEQEEEDLIQVYLKRILTRLLRMNKVGAAHTELGHFFKGVPAQWRGTLKEILDILIADGYVRLKPTLKSPHISLEPRPLPLIKQYLEGGPVPPGKLADYLFEVSSSVV